MENFSKAKKVPVNVQETSKIPNNGKKVPLLRIITTLNILNKYKKSYSQKNKVNNRMSNV